MSAIDAYKRTLLGVAHCPSRFELVYQNDSHRDVPLYRLDQDVEAGNSDFDGNAGDLLLGGGGGESAAFRVSMPEAIRLFTSSTEDLSFTRHPERYYRAFWTFSDAFVFGDGYERLGWKPRTDLASWLAENIVAFVLREYPATYAAAAGPEALVVDGRLLRVPSAEDVRLWTPTGARHCDGSPTG